MRWLSTGAKRVAADAEKREQSRSAARRLGPREDAMAAEVDLVGIGGFGEGEVGKWRWGTAWRNAGRVGLGIN
jgi:hypothetical protein